MAIEVIENHLFKHRRDKDGRKIVERKRFFKDSNNGIAIEPSVYRPIIANFTKTKNKLIETKKEYENAKKEFENAKKEFDNIDEIYYYKEDKKCEGEPKYKHGLCIGSVGLAMSYDNTELRFFIDTMLSKDNAQKLGLVGDQAKNEKEAYKNKAKKYLDKAMENHASYNEIKKKEQDKYKGFEAFFKGLKIKDLKLIEKKTFEEIHEDFKNRATDSVSRLGFAIFIFYEDSHVGHVVYLVKYDDSIAFFEPSSGVIKAEISNANTEEAIDSLINSDDYKKFIEVLKVKDETTYDYYIHDSFHS